MTELRERDLRGALELIDRVGDSPDLASFRGSVIDGLVELVESDLGAVGGLDPIRHVSTFVDQPRGAIDREAAEWLERNPFKHPGAHYALAVGGTAAVKLSDFVTQQQHLGSELYSECHGRFKARYELDVSLLGPGRVPTTISLHRHSRDFSERDRQLLALLAPYLLRAREDAALRDRVKLESRATAEGLGLIHLDGLGAVEAMTSLAAWAIRKTTGHELTLGEPLPPGIDEELPNVYFVPRHGLGQGSLVVIGIPDTIDPGALIAHGLTRREVQVLELVARGLINQAIASELGISPRTVQKHLERVHQKLGVGTRTAAVAKAIELSRG